MPEYIEREDVLQKFADHVRRSNNSDFAPTPTWNQAVQIVEDTLAADVQPARHGRWERKKDPYEFFDTIPVCSVCGCTTKWREEYLFCPNCGAKMDGGADNA